MFDRLRDVACCWQSAVVFATLRGCEWEMHAVRWHLSVINNAFVGALVRIVQPLTDFSAVVGMEESDGGSVLAF